MRFSLRQIFIVTAIVAVIVFLLRPDNRIRSPLGPLESPSKGLKLLKAFQMPIRFTHHSPLTDIQGSMIFRFVDPNGESLVMLWSGGGSICFASAHGSTDENPWDRQREVAFDGDNNADIKAELEKLLTSAASQPLPEDPSYLAKEYVKNMLEHLIQRVRYIRPLKPNNTSDG